MNIGVIGRLGGEAPHLSVDGLRLVACAGGETGAQAGPIDLCVPALPARYQFNCPFTAGHPEPPERTGANRSEPERTSGPAVPAMVQGTAAR